MDLLSAEIGGGGGKRSVADSELAKVMFEGTQQYRKKLKMPEMGAEADKFKEALDDMSFAELWEEDEVGRFFLLRYVQDVHPVHGTNMLLINHYKYSAHKKREIATDLVDGIVTAVTDIWSAEDPETLIEAYREGKKAVANPNKKSRRSRQKAGKIEEAKKAQVAVQEMLNRGTPVDLLDEINGILKDDLDEYFPSFRTSKYADSYARARAMELEKCSEEDFHQFRVLGVGGFGAVHAALKKDTGALLAIKRMDKKLIKHKNRYKSCFTEINALRAMSSPFVCGLHYSYQTKDDVCLVLDLLQGGTLSYLLSQKKKVSERYVAFFTACIVLAYEVLHKSGFVYRDMKPANVLIKDNGYCVLIDFGLAAKMDTALKGKCGTRGYWAPEMVRGGQYLSSGDWWSLGVTLIELLTGKKPFKKKFQKYKNTDDKVKIVNAGQIEDVIEEHNIEKKLGAAKEVDDDGRDSNDEETDEEDEGEEKKRIGAEEEDRAKEKRRSSVRVIGGFDKTLASAVETEVAMEFWDDALSKNDALRVFKDEAFDGGPARFLRLMSIVTFEPEQELMLAGEFGTFFCLVLEGKIKGDDGKDYGVGSLCGMEGLFQDNFHRPVKMTAGVQGGTIGIFLYSELARAELFDAEAMNVVKELVIKAMGKDGVEGVMESLRSRVEEFGDMEDTHAEEGFIAQCKHTKKADTVEEQEKKAKELSASRQRDQKIYLTQEVWVKKGVVSRECEKFLRSLLTRDVNKRLGCHGFPQVKEHDWFQSNNVDYAKLESGTAVAPYIPKKEVNAKEEAKMKTFNTTGMKKLNKDDQEKWNEWDWTSAIYYRQEMAMYQYEQWALHDYKKGRGGGSGSGGCCEIS